MTTEPTLNISELHKKTRDELLAIGQEMGMDNGSSPTGLRKEEIVFRIVSKSSSKDNLLGSGILEIMGQDYGFLRQENLKHGPGDIYVSQSQVRRFGLRSGDRVLGHIRPPKGGERYFGLIRVDSVNDIDPDQARTRPLFEDLTPIFPEEHIKLETKADDLTARMVDLFAPIGKGQRGLVVAPPKAGKTTILKQIAAGVAKNSPEIHIMVVLIGERPEEVTDMQRSIKGEVFASTFDESVEDQCRLADLALERAKRLVESGRDVFIIMDSITRATRAYNLALPSSGRTLSGGMDPVALYPPKRFFGAARNVEFGGSLTIIANCLVDTGSRMDEVIYEEFKGTGNMELHLDRKLSEKRIFPAIDIVRSGTRREELFFSDIIAKQILLLRRMVGLLSGDSHSSNDVLEKILKSVSDSSNNESFLADLGKKAGKAP